MSDDESAGERRPPSRGPAAWIRDDKFWRDITVNTVTGLLLIFLTWFAAVALGYLKQPEFVHGLVNFMGVVADISLVIGSVLVIAFVAKGRRRLRPYWIWVAIAVLIPYAVIILTTELILEWNYAGP